MSADDDGRTLRGAGDRSATRAGLTRSRAAEPAGYPFCTSDGAARIGGAACRVMHKPRQANLGRSEKMELLYNYICSPQFAQRVKSVVEGFEAMKRDLDGEKAAMTRIWKKREMQLTRMTTGMLGVVGDLQGIGQEGMTQLESIAVLPGIGQEEFESDAEK
ncbi:MAG: DUF2130 domain-containing protein [Betaproteobacteria bacterium]|nr:MAG: DUF2130 domain-containing protein [Betaproteobacteria bacterium]